MSVKPTKIKVPGSKSMTNRILLLASLSERKITIKNIGHCDDTKYMASGISQLESKSLLKTPINLFTGNAGTATRFLVALSTLLEKTITIDGDNRMRQRPISELIDALNNLGAKVSSKNGFLPVTIRPQKLQGGTIKLRGAISSQYLSALLMTTPFATQDTVIKIEQKLCSTPYIKMTLDILEKFKIKIVNKNFEQFEIKGNQRIIAPKTITIESDASSASYLGAYAALHPSTPVLLENINQNSIQGDIKFLDYLKKMGCQILPQENGNTLIKGPKTLNSLGEIDMNNTPDLVMTFAILAMFTEGVTKITNIENLKIKETDRLEALKNEISKLGIKVKTGKDFIEIHGNPDLLNKKTEIHSPITIETYNDHRIAMSFAIIQDILPFIKIKNRNCVSKSYTRFWNDLKQLQSNGKI